MTVWEHHFTSTYMCSDSDVDVMLNRLGGMGWELVAVVAIQPYPAKVYYFKRAIPDTSRWAAGPR